MQTLTSLKRELKNYKALTLVECSFPNRLLNIEREIALVDTVQFALWTTNSAGKRVKSYMYFPKAANYSYNESENSFKFSDGKDYFIYQLIN